MTEGNIFSLLSKALSATVINPDRSTVPRYIIINTGSIRFDLVQGPFSFDDSFIVSPFDDAFQYIPNVPYTSSPTPSSTADLALRITAPTKNEPAPRN
jgi:hypothetical protein